MVSHVPPQSRPCITASGLSQPQESVEAKRTNFRANCRSRSEFDLLVVFLDAIVSRTNKAYTRNTISISHDKCSFRYIVKNFY